VHLVGHSMGARVALLLAVRFPRLLDSVAIVDIGPEASASNVAQTARGVSLRPERVWR
jgi:pimeloyl-ACP methyl ester carboxylesterase